MFRSFNRQSSPVSSIPEVDDLALARLLRQAESGEHIDPKTFFSQLSEALHANDRVVYRAVGKVSQPSPLYDLSGDCNQRVLRIFEAYFDPQFFEDAASIKDDWELVPDEVKKISLQAFDGEDAYLTTPAIIYRNARAQKAANPSKDASVPKSAELFDIGDYRPDEPEAAIA